MFFLNEVCKKKTNEEDENLDEDFSLDEMLEFDFEIIGEAVKLPGKTKSYYNKKSNRRKMLEKYGKEAFLDPDNLKYPIINPQTGKPDCKLIYSARARALEFHKDDIVKKAEEAYRANGCELKLKTKIKTK
jgi:hypothetical protein